MRMAMSSALSPSGRATGVRPRLAACPDRRRARRAAALSAGAGLLLVVASMVVPLWLDDDVRVHWPPLHADWDPRFGLLTLPAIAIGLLLVAGAAPARARRCRGARCSRRRSATAWLWIVAVAMTEGTEGLARTFERRQEYVYDAQSVGSIHTMLQTFIDRIPIDAPDNWYVHVAGHPPGALLYFVGLDRLGITDPFWIGVVCVTIASTADRRRHDHAARARLRDARPLGDAVDRAGAQRGVDGRQRRRRLHGRRGVGAGAAGRSLPCTVACCRPSAQACCWATASTCRTACPCWASWPSRCW